MALDLPSYLLGKSKGGGGSSGALVPIVVQELPETGEAGKLYLVPRQTSETNNVFDEYIWVNSEYEKIGTAELNVDFDEIIMLQRNNTGATAITKVEKAINNAIKNNRTSAYALVTGEAWTLAGGSKGYLLKGTIRPDDNPNSSPLANITFASDEMLAVPYGTSEKNSKYNRLKVTGSWDNTNKYYTVNSISFDYYTISNTYLLTNNTNSYTPTQQYHPATKGYVDSAIASAITDALGGNY